MAQHEYTVELIFSHVLPRFRKSWMMDDDEASFGLTTGQTNIDAIANLSTPWMSHSQIFSCVITRFESVSFEKTMVKASSTFATMRRLEMKLTVIHHSS
jgi:hypothetical protein